MKNNHQPKRTQSTVTIKNYEKHFETFASMINELKSLHPEVDYIFTNLSKENFDPTPVNAIFCLIDYVNGGRVPDVNTRANLPVALSFAANKASLKTMNFVSFSWSFKYNKDNTITDIVANFVTYSRGNNDSEELVNTINILTNKENGWKDITRTNKFEK